MISKTRNSLRTGKFKVRVHAHLNVLYVVFTCFLMIQVIFSKIELEISPFLTVIQFCSNINEKRVRKSPQEISTRPTCRAVAKATRHLVMQMQIFLSF